MRHLVISLLTSLSLGACEQITPLTNEGNAVSTPASAAKVLTFDSYYSPYSHGPTLRLYHFEEDKAVLALRFANQPGNLSLKATLNIFPPSTDKLGIDKWINNQHSDALYADAATPKRQDVTNLLSDVTRASEGTKAGRSGETYDVHNVSFTMDSIAAGRLVINGFSDTATVYVITSTPEPSNY
jgi:hypothetical protein